MADQIKLDCLFNGRTEPLFRAGYFWRAKLFLASAGLFAVLISTARAADSTDHPPVFSASNLAAEKTATEQDHRHLMELLHITSLRSGRDGYHTNSPLYANYDEAKANPFPDLPDPLVLNDGEKVTTPEMWWQKRRPEIAGLFDREIYGRVPPNTPAVNWEITGVTRETNGTIPVITKKLVGRADNSADTNIAVNIRLTLTTPANATAPVPVIMQYAFNFPNFMNIARTRGTNPAQPAGTFVRDAGPDWQRQVLARGWGYAVFTPTSVQADNGAGLRSGIIGLVNHGQPRTVDQWGALRAWAWGASRALDYFETDKSVDARRVGIEGHSRYGKAVLVTMAYDPRFAIAYVSSSGEGGAKLFRRNWGETVENVAASGEYHWMAGNFLKYAGPLNWNDLPVDAHELIALCAPRPVFITGGTLLKGDGWADAKGMFMAAAAAGPVYDLLGKRDLGTTDFPPVETALINGDIAFRQHDGGHTDALDWPVFLKFADRYFGTK